MKFCSESKDSDILLWICGLTIYKSRLVSHNKSHNAIIGGPHTSFQALADKVGNVGALLTHFTEGLKHLRSLGPPRIPVNPLSTEDEFFCNFKECYRVCRCLEFCRGEEESMLFNLFYGVI